MTGSLNKPGLIGFLLIVVIGTLIFFLKEDLPHLYINEFMANNTSCCPDTDGGRDEFDDWIEIYNPGTQPIDIGGMYISQNKNNPKGHQIPTTDKSITTIQPEGYLLLWADEMPEQGILHLNFKLNQKGEYLGLHYIDGRKINGLTFGQQTENYSYGRKSDGGKTWKVFSVPTPGKSNRPRSIH